MARPVVKFNAQVSTVHDGNSIGMGTPLLSGGGFSNGSICIALSCTVNSTTFDGRVYERTNRKHQQCTEIGVKLEIIESKEDVRELKSRRCIDTSYDTGKQFVCCRGATDTNFEQKRYLLKGTDYINKGHRKVTMLKRGYQATCIIINSTRVFDCRSALAEGRKAGLRLRKEGKAVKCRAARVFRRRCRRRKFRISYDSVAMLRTFSPSKEFLSLKANFTL